MLKYVGRLVYVARIFKNVVISNALLARPFFVDREFQSKTRTANLQLIDLRKNVVEFALDPQGSAGGRIAWPRVDTGSHVIQKALASVYKASQIEIIDELTPRACVIRCIKDQYGAYVMNTIFELLEPEQLQFVVDAISNSPSDSVASLSLHEYGHWVIRRVLEHCTEQQKRLVLEQLHDIVLTLATDQCIKDQYGAYVMNTIFELLEPEQLQFVVDAISNSPSDSVASLSLHEYGHWVIRRVLEHCTEQQKHPVLEQLHDIRAHMIEHGLPEDRKRIVRSLHENVLTLATDQYGSFFQVYSDNSSGNPAIVEHIPALLRLKARQLEHHFNRLPAPFEHNKGGGAQSPTKEEETE
uniref:PUM-HD domain-containing protein n=1 Tax=Globodera pallida TaxID=36090 RepID=A0A183CHM5_GLOPA